VLINSSGETDQLQILSGALFRATRTVAPGFRGDGERLEKLRSFGDSGAETHPLVGVELGHGEVAVGEASGGDWALVDREGRARWRVAWRFRTKLEMSGRLFETMRMGWEPERGPHSYLNVVNFGPFTAGARNGRTSNQTKHGPTYSCRATSGSLGRRWLSRFAIAQCGPPAFLATHLQVTRVPAYACTPIMLAALDSARSLEATAHRARRARNCRRSKASASGPCEPTQLRPDTRTLRSHRARADVVARARRFREPRRRKRIVPDLEGRR
jgi:hypothetical protein